MRAVALAMCMAAALAFSAPTGAAAFGPISSFGSYGAGIGQMNKAGGMAIDAKGFIYIADSLNHRIVVFSPKEEFVRAFGKEVSPTGGSVCTAVTGCRTGTVGSGAGALNRPADVAVDAAGNVFVAGPNNNRVDVFAPEGAFLRAFGKEVASSGPNQNVCTAATGCRQGDENDEAGALHSPTGVGVNSSGQVFVADTRNHRISVFSAAGAFLFAFGRDVGKSGADICTGVDDAGECRDGEQKGAGGMDEPLDVAIDANGQVAVADSENHRVDVFSVNVPSPSSSFLFAFGKAVDPFGADVCTAATGCNEGQESGVAAGLRLPSSIAADASRNIYVADAGNNRVSEFTAEGAFVRAFGEGVVDGQPVFQICTALTGCAVGIPSMASGSVSSPFGTAIDCEGAVYATEWLSPSFSRVERFGEAETASCAEPEPETEPPPTPTPGSGSTAGSGSALPASSSGLFPAADRPGIAKPKFRIELNKWDGTATLIVVISDTGTLLVRGKGIRKVKRAAKRIGELELLLEGTDKVKRKLKKAGKAKVKMSLTFMPDQGDPNTQAASVTLKLGPLL